MINGGIQQLGRRIFNLAFDFTSIDKRANFLFAAIFLSAT
jgi:hypothetical protein